MEVFISFLRINTYLLFFRTVFFTVSQALGNVQRDLSQCCWRRGLCALSELVGLVSVSLVLMRQRSGVPFSLSLNDGQKVHLSLPPAVLEIPRLSLVTEVTVREWIFIPLEEY